MLKRSCCGRSPAKVAEVPDDSLAPSIEVLFIVRHEAETPCRSLTPIDFHSKSLSGNWRPCSGPTDQVGMSRLMAVPSSL
jgi:hypothetical protein